MKIRKGDTVKILYGVERGKTGKVLKVLPKKQEVIVEGANIKKKHVRGDGQTKKSEIVDVVKPMPVGKVQLIDPNTGDPTRVGYKEVKGEKVRYAKRSGKVLDSSNKTEKKKEEKEKKEKKKNKKGKKKDK
jgi:large subunit ribosomal protein L24